MNGARATRRRLLLFDVPCCCGQARGASGLGRTSHRGLGSESAHSSRRVRFVCVTFAPLHQCATPLSTQLEWAASWENASQRRLLSGVGKAVSCAQHCHQLCAGVHLTAVQATQCAPCSSSRSWQLRLLRARRQARHLPRVNMGALRQAPHAPGAFESSHECSQSTQVH